jgi:hypothetical protein
MGDQTIAWPVPSQHREIPFSTNEPIRILDCNIRGLIRGSWLRFPEVSWAASCNECVFCKTRKEGYIGLPFKAYSVYVNGLSADRQNVLRCVLTSILCCEGGHAVA